MPPLSIEQRLMAVEMSLFGSTRPPMKGLVQELSDVRTMIVQVKEDMTAIRDQVQDLADSRKFWLQIILTGIAAGAAITAAAVPLLIK